MTKPSRPAKAAAPSPCPEDTPLDNIFSKIFSAVDAGDFSERDRLLAEGAGDQQVTKTGNIPITGHTATLMTAMSPTSSKDRAASRKAYERLLQPVRLLTRGNPREHAVALRHGRPHLTSAINTVLRDLAPREVIRLRPMILVGKFGCGKTTLARAIATQLGLPSIVYPAAGVADGTFGGTSAHWSNTAPSVVVQMLLQYLVGNPCIIVDEVDKSTEGNHNGSLKDVLLGFLDRGNASVFRDPSLESVVDCSHVNWILTANDVDRIPGPLKDRCRIIRVPDPEWRHVGEVSRSILDSIAEERDLDRRWLPDLDQDEIDLIKPHWDGGSIRRLRRIVETIVDVRDEHLPRA